MTMATQAPTRPETISAEDLEEIVKESPPVHAALMFNGVKVVPVLSHPLYNEMEWIWIMVEEVAFNSFWLEYDGREAIRPWCHHPQGHMTYPGDDVTLGLDRHMLFAILDGQDT